MPKRFYFHRTFKTFKIEIKVCFTKLKDSHPSNLVVSLIPVASQGLEENTGINLSNVRVELDQFQPNTIDLSARLWGINTEFVGFISQSIEVSQTLNGKPYPGSISATEALVITERKQKKFEPN